MTHHALLKNLKIGFVGTGNMTQAIVSALIESGAMKAEQIWASNRSPGKLQKVKEKWGINTVENNEEVVDECDVIVLAVKPQDITSAVEPISRSFRDDQVVISLAAGYSLDSLKKLISMTPRHVRVMTNTAAKIRQAVVGYCLADEKDEALSALVEDLFSPMGYVVHVEEGEQFEALMVATSSGVGFVFELMIYWQEWLEERGIDPEAARKMTVETFYGASKLAKDSEGVTIEELQNQVTSKKGVTAAGLASMRELEAERAIRYSFEKAALRDRELGR